MRYVVCFVITIAIVTIAAAPAALGQIKVCTTTRSKIVGGENARTQEWPGQAVFRWQWDGSSVPQYFCGGTAISDRWVLTAAHCMYEFLNGPTVPDPAGKRDDMRFEVVLGAEDLTKVRPDQVYAVEHVVIHERYRAALEKAMNSADNIERLIGPRRIAS